MSGSTSTSWKPRRNFWISVRTLGRERMISDFSDINMYDDSWKSSSFRRHQKDNIVAHSFLCSSFLSVCPPTNTRTLHLAQRFLRVSKYGSSSVRPGGNTHIHEHWRGNLPWYCWSKTQRGNRWRCKHTSVIGQPIHVDGLLSLFFLKHCRGLKLRCNDVGSCNEFNTQQVILVYRCLKS